MVPKARKPAIFLSELAASGVTAYRGRRVSEQYHRDQDACQAHDLQRRDALTEDDDSEQRCDDDVEVRKGHHHCDREEIEREAVEERSHASDQTDANSSQSGWTRRNCEAMGQDECYKGGHQAAGAYQRVELERSKAAPYGTFDEGAHANQHDVCPNVAKRNGH
jgi:hypothetical protein